MSLKKAFFCLAMVFLFAALILSILFILAIGVILRQYGTSLEMKIDSNSIIIPFSALSSDITVPLWHHVLVALQIALPVIFATASLFLAYSVFYRMKIKKPIAELQAGAERIMENDLDFTVQYISQDELGRLCNSFEKMRLELLKNNQELWRQTEERKRLNAAFSHDLRNPVTVLKGLSNILKKGLSDGTLSPAKVKEYVGIMEKYTKRIEMYIEAMSSVQRLEELQCLPEKISLESFIKEIGDSINLLVMNTGIKVEVNAEEHLEKLKKNVWLDKAIIFNVMENLVANAVRFAKNKIQVNLRLDEETLVLSVQDDGPGFSQTILQKGTEPFFRGDEDNEQSIHFGMGLYICRLLCEKHNGSLKLQNTPSGALVIAKFKVYKT